MKHMLKLAGLSVAMMLGAGAAQADSAEQEFAFSYLKENLTSQAGLAHIHDRLDQESRRFCRSIIERDTRQPTLRSSEACVEKVKYEVETHIDRRAQMYAALDTTR